MKVALPRARVAIVHDYLTQRGGAERVTLAMTRAFYGAPIFTSIYKPEQTFPEFRNAVVIPSFLQRVPFLISDHRRGLPLYAPTFSAMRIDADVVLCSTSGWAHGVRGTGRRLLYVHNTARWLYQRGDYVRKLGPTARVATNALTPALRSWDRQRGSSAEAVLVNSRTVQERVRRAWGIEAEVLYPPHGASPDKPQEPVPNLDDGFLLVVARLLPYKRVDAVIAAMRDLATEQLVVVGTGPQEPHLRDLAAANCVLLGNVTDAQLRWLYAHCSVLVSAAHDDLGLAPIEAMAFGRPVAVLNDGGYRETVVDGATGMFFPEASPRAIAHAVRAVLAETWNADTLVTHAAQFSEERFAEALRSTVNRMLVD